MASPQDYYYDSTTRTNWLISRDLRYGFVGRANEMYVCQGGPLSGIQFMYSYDFVCLQEENRPAKYIPELWKRTIHGTRILRYEAGTATELLANLTAPVSSPPPPPPAICPDCKGSKVYVGLSKTESCRRCGGTGLERTGFPGDSSHNSDAAIAGLDSATLAAFQRAMRLTKFIPPKTRKIP